MEFTEEERKALEEKYKEQRRAMWTGKRPPSIAQEENSEKALKNPNGVDKPPQRSASHTVPNSNRTRTEPLARKQPTAVSSRASVGKSGQTRSNTTGTAHKNSGATVSTNYYSGSQQVIQKIRSQREEIWEGNSSTRSRERRRWRGTAGKVGKFWNPPRQEEVETPRRWKLALGVFGAIAVLVSLGILLGYLFAR